MGTGYTWPCVSLNCSAFLPLTQEKSKIPFYAIQSPACNEEFCENTTTHFIMKRHPYHSFASYSGCM